MLKRQVMKRHSSVGERLVEVKAVESICCSLFETTNFHIV